MKKDEKKERAVLAVSRALAILSVIAAVTLLVVYFAKAQSLSASEYLVILIPIGCLGLLTTAIVIFLSKDIRRENP